MYSVTLVQRKKARQLDTIRAFPGFISTTFLLYLLHSLNGDLDRHRINKQKGSEMRLGAADVMATIDGDPFTNQSAEMLL